MHSNQMALRWLVGSEIKLISEMDEVEKNIEYLKQNIKSKCLGITKYKDSNFKLDI